MSGEATDVEITVKAVGPVGPTRIRVPAYVKVSDLKTLVASDRRLPLERLKLVLHGKTLQERKNGEDEDASVRLENGDSLIVAVMPKPPAKHLREDDDNDDDLKFHVPQSTTWWKRKLFYLLHERLRLPGIPCKTTFSTQTNQYSRLDDSAFSMPRSVDMVLIAVFSISLKAWAGIILWFLFAPIAHRWDVGLYIYSGLAS